ncbi:MAG: Zn-ribbon domain-containing OB-fold protein [Anaerolineales bacterium]
MYPFHHPFDRPSHYEGLFPVTNRYTFGIAGEKFFRALKEEGVILGTLCPICNKLYVPGINFCEECLLELDDWQVVENVGTVSTFTLLYKNLDGSPRLEPEIVAFIQMGNGGLVHRLAEIDPKSVFIGMQVAAVIKEPDERIGSILDIRYFKPI